MLSDEGWGLVPDELLLVPRGEALNDNVQRAGQH